MIEKIAHIGIAVKDIDKHLKLYRDILGMKIGERVKVPDQGVEVVFLETGDTRIELLQPLNEDANINKFLEKRGEGQHHICLEVDDIEAELKNLEENGIQLIDKKPRKGACGEMVAFLHPKSTGGVLIELEQKKK
ncbi:MAG: methylmalonyl-CoA epimerase [candidate division Zixibacteria bacterium]|nr:methylmalonyl-CoA epimerase [candidate division Zixibacteria bacterium]NIR62500.1 methylmalonyl-CoA epimerase [candidate division Zixibacteria bacterium]NIS15206.1 methylmalonyl-CoA epimerase [candidate division Zixibacteria bacterium]NIS44637.1 methylmalonyl-CoA epimerase [candidate division Zixibacteria bacterium]NIT51722.1 methylmalonyl-CoA epimerase [candidate division Zixibacteria bacterium]